MNGRLHFLRRGCGLVVFAAVVVFLIPQGLTLTALDQAQQTGETRPADDAEISSHDSQPAFHLRVQHNEVVVRVVVRDAKGQVVRNLQKEDFRVFDNRKPELITHFMAEGAAVTPKGEPPSGDSAKPEASNAGHEPAPPIILPSRFMALYFDDVHLQIGDLILTRDAAGRYLDSRLQAGDRAAIFTSSGQNQVDFTDDHARLHDALSKLRPRPIYPVDRNECPPITPYQAYKIIDQRDDITLQAAQADAFMCHCEATGRANDPQCPAEADRLVMPTALREQNRAESESHYALDGLRRVCRRMAGLPGQQTIVLVSPGFLTVNQLTEVNDLVDLALRQNMVVSTLDARGLYALTPLGDASDRPLVIAGRPDLESSKVYSRAESAERDADVLESLAYQTGGVYFHNNNDLNEGFRLTGAFPEAFYVLAFAPQDLKLDGRLHTLKVSLAANPDHYTVQARRGYFAPSKLEDTTTLAKEELEQMIFSQDEPQTIPLQVHTQFFEGQAGDAKISVLAHLDLSGLRFRKAEGRNLENVTVVTALFDRQGNYVTGEQKEIQFRLLDATLERLNRTGLSMKSSLPAKSGTYLVREVVQESEGGEMSASNSQVEIP
jgi:VWFA-related protein